MASTIGSGGVHGEGRAQFEKLRPGNYSTWVRYASADLERRDYLEYALGEADIPEKPEDSANATLKKAYREAKKLDRKAYSRIIELVEESELGHIPMDVGAAEAWKALKDAHIAQGFGTKLSLRRSFMFQVMKQGEAMSAWIGRVKAAASKCKQAGSEVTDEEIVVVLTNGLSSDYTHLITQMDSLADSKVTLQSVTAGMLNEEARISLGQAIWSNQSGHESANVASTKRDKSDITCYNCWKKGHFKNECQNEKQEKPKETAASAALAANNILPEDPSSKFFVPPYIPVEGFDNVGFKDGSKSLDHIEFAW